MRSPPARGLRAAFAAAACSVAAAAQDGGAAAEAAADVEARARAIHAATLTLDTHKDIRPELATPPPADADDAARERWRRRCDPTVDGDNQVDFPKMRAGGYDCAFFIVYVGQGRNDGAGYVRARQQALLKFDAIHRMCEQYPEQIGLATTPDAVESLAASGKLIACIGIENGYCMGEDLDLVEEFWRRGARYMSIAHNRHSQLGDSHTPAEPLHGGLSELGRRAVAEMNRVGIMVDVSHASKATMMQALAASKAPVIASHSGCSAVNAHTRNLDDEQLRALAANGGVVQCVALADYVRATPARDAAIRALREELGIGRRDRDARANPDDFDTRLQRYRDGLAAIEARYPRADVAAFVDHIDHAVAVAGIDHVGIGSDFDGGGGIDGWNDASTSANVTIELVRRGYTAAQIGKIWSGNLLRVWRAVERRARELQAAGR